MHTKSHPRAALLLLGALLGGCDEACPVGTLAASHYCGDDGASCLRLEELSQGCIGSHTEQDCKAGGETFVRVGGDDAADLFYDDAGALVAVRRIGEGDETCEDAWFGRDLSDCEPQGDPVTVSCESQGE